MLIVMLNEYIHQESTEKVNLYCFESKCLNDHKNIFMHSLNTLNGDLIHKHICTGYSSSSKHFVIFLKYSTKMSNYLKIFFIIL